MKKNTVLFFGPYPEPITGQSVSFKATYDNYYGEKILLNTTKYGENGLLNNIYAIFRLPIIFLFCRFNKVYFTCTRSVIGFIKDFFLLALSALFNKKVINHLHGADLQYFLSRSPLLRFFIIWSYNKISTSIVLLPSMRDQFAQFPAMDIQVVTNCYSKEYNSVVVDVTEKKRQILYLSGIMLSKGILDFLDASDVLLERDPNLTVIVAGKPMSDWEMSKQKIETHFDTKRKKLELKYQDRFSYVGVVKGKTKELLLRESDIFVLPTYYKTEALPISIIEAMRFGNAIVTTNHNYLADLVSDQNGKRIPVKSVKDLIIAIQDLLNEEELLRTIQLNNMDFAVKNYNPDQYTYRMNKLIEE